VKAKILSLALLAGFSVVAFAEEAAPPPAPVNATFQRMKSLVGNWSGTMSDGTPATVSYELVSDGSAIMERLGAGTKYEMISMYAPDGDGVMMTHYCGMHNQPRMRAGATPEGPIHFAFVDATNLASPNDPHMDSVTIALPENGAFSQDWSFKAGGKATSDKFSYTRAK
jgi:hypothetical protein